MDKFIGTKEAAARLQVNPSRLSRAVWEGRLSEPQRAPSGAFLWAEEDLEKAAWVLTRHALRAAPSTELRKMA